MKKINTEKVEKTFTNADELMYNDGTNVTSIETQVEAQLKSDRYLPTNDLAFRKMMTSPENIHISEGLLNDLAQNDPLKALQIDTLVNLSPYNSKQKNKLKNTDGKGILYTEVDYACADSGGAQFLIELQLYKETHLEKRILYNTSEKYTSNYGGKKRKEKQKTKRKKKKLIKYNSLRPVIAITILNESYYKDDPHPIRFLRPHDTSIDVYKKDLLMGLEIYLELDKDVTKQPKNIQDIFQFFRTGTTSATAADYLKEAADQMVKINYTPEEQRLADIYIRAQMKRISEDDYVREEGREEGREEERKKAEVEKTELLQQAKIEKAELLQQAEVEKIANAKKMIEDNFSVEMVEHYTGLSAEKIKQLL